MKYLGIRRASEALGITKNAIKKRRQRGKIDFVVTDDGMYLYAVPDDDDVRISEEDIFQEDTLEVPIPTVSFTEGEDKEKTSVKKAISIYDAHVPFHDKATWYACLEVIKNEKPDEVILVGDFLDVSSMSAHPSGGWEIGSLSEEIEHGREAIRELRNAAGSAKIYFLEGNHESRPRRTAQQRLSAVVDLVAIDRLLGLKEMGIQWVPEGRALKRGHLRFVHGYWTNDHHAKTHLVKLLWPGVVYGHTHRPQMYSFADGDGSIRVAYGMPCMCKLDAEWMRGQPTGWVNGFGVTLVDETSGQFNVYPILSFNGKFLWNGKLYDGNKILEDRLSK